MIKICVICGKEFEISYPQQKTCGKECSIINAKKKQKEYRQRAEVKEHRKKYMKEYQRKYYQRPGVKEKYSKKVSPDKNDKAIALWLSDGFTPLERTRDKDVKFKDGK